MCARFYRFKDLRDFYIRFKIHEILSSLEPQYNIAPTEQAFVIPATDSVRNVKLMRFGLKNPWKEGVGLLLNMKAESFMNKPGFKKYLQYQRCMILADGFFEWRKTPGGSTPFGFSLKNKEPFGFAGIYVDDDFAIITTAANSVVGQIHDRMPVILRPAEEDLWLDSKVTEFSTLIPFLSPYPEEDMICVELSKLANSPKNKGSEVLAPPHH